MTEEECVFLIRKRCIVHGGIVCHNEVGGEVTDRHKIVMRGHHK